MNTLDLRRATAKKPSRRKVWLIIPGAVVVLALFGAGVMFGVKHFWPDSDKGRSGMQRAVAAVGKLMILPEGETPTYGTVADAGKLKNQTFFAQAQNGDEVLIYEKARLTILYRPGLKKIVNVGPLVVGSQGSPYVTSTIAIENGTDNDDVLSSMTKAVTQAFPNARIVYKGKASRTYPTSIVIDVTKKNQPLAEQVADSLKIQAGKQPLAEPEPAADMLIIIGQDYHVQ